MDAFGLRGCLCFRDCCHLVLALCIKLLRQPALCLKQLTQATRVATTAAHACTMKLPQQGLPFGSCSRAYPLNCLRGCLCSRDCCYLVLALCIKLLCQITLCLKHLSHTTLVPITTTKACIAQQAGAVKLSQQGLPLSGSIRAYTLDCLTLRTELICQRALRRKHLSHATLVAAAAATAHACVCELRQQSLPLSGSLRAYALNYLRGCLCSRDCCSFLLTLRTELICQRALRRKHLSHATLVAAAAATAHACVCELRQQSLPLSGRLRAYALNCLRGCLCSRDGCSFLLTLRTELLRQIALRREELSQAALVATATQACVVKLRHRGLLVNGHLRAYALKLASSCRVYPASKGAASTIMRVAGECYASTVSHLPALGRVASPGSERKPLTEPLHPLSNELELALSTRTVPSPLAPSSEAADALQRDLAVQH